jgi:hypothetical protein
VNGYAALCARPVLEGGPNSALTSASTGSAAGHGRSLEPLAASRARASAYVRDRAAQLESAQRALTRIDRTLRKAKNQPLGPGKLGEQHNQGRNQQFDTGRQETQVLGVLTGSS